MKIVIAGAGEVGSHLAKMLSNEANEITVLDSDQERLETLSSNTDVITVNGNPSAIRTLHDADVQHADLFIAVNPSVSHIAYFRLKINCKSAIRTDGNFDCASTSRQRRVYHQFRRNCISPTRSVVYHQAADRCTLKRDEIQPQRG